MPWSAGRGEKRTGRRVRQEWGGAAEKRVVRGVKTAERAKKKAASRSRRDGPQRTQLL